MTATVFGDQLMKVHWPKAGFLSHSLSADLKTPVLWSKISCGLAGSIPCLWLCAMAL